MIGDGDRELMEIELGDRAALYLEWSWLDQVMISSRYPAAVNSYLMRLGLAIEDGHSGA